MAEMWHDYPVRLEADYPAHPSRLLALCGILLPLKAFLLLPHLIIVYFVNLAAAIVVFVAFWVVLFTGRYPRGMYEFTLGALRWQTRMTAWMWGLVDRYPPFSLH
jgi:hypothetical protein